MKVGKPQSKRTPVRLRHKIEKAAAAKRRKDRKKAKKDPTWRSRLKKDPGIPNLFPFKEKVLQDIEEKKRLKAEEQARKREEAKLRRAELAQEDDIKDQVDIQVEAEAGGEALLDYSDAEDEDVMDADDSNPMAALLASARARAAEYEQVNGAASEGDMDEEEWDGMDEDGPAIDVPHRKDSSRKAYDKVFKEVVDAADVILYVLDARDPEGTRSKDVERQVMAADSGSKRLILILNKIDLVPPKVLQGWLSYLQRYFPTIPLAAAHPATNAHSFDHKRLTVKGTSEKLLKSLKAFSQSRQLKRSTSVGVTGYPNVGKSSVINSLTTRLGGRTASCPTGAEAGVTTNLREVKLDNKLKLLDSPGIVFPSKEGSTETKSSKSEEQARLILLNAIPPKDIDDPLPAVALLLRRLSTSEDLLAKLYSLYSLPTLMSVDGDITNDFLIHVARKRGRLGRGGVPNLQSAAQTVLNDWRDGRIQGWVDPPTLPVANAISTDASDEVLPTGDQKKIVQEWADEFKIEGLWGDDEGDGDTMQS